MRTYAFILILVAMAASQPHHWVAVVMAAITRCMGR
jgi:hypothetical protein